MKKIKLILFFLVPFTIYAQDLSSNFNILLEDKKIKEIVDLWQEYLKTGSNKYWNQTEVEKYKNFNILNMGGILNPPIMEYGLNNRILSIRKENGNYIIRSMFYLEEQIFAITDVLVKEIQNELKLSNFILEHVKNWETLESAYFKYYIHPDYHIKLSNIKLAEKFYVKVCKIFDIPIQKITYFIVKDCNDIYKTLGYNYIFSESIDTECGYFEPSNNFIFSTMKGGENHYHEITHYVNKFFPNAHYLLLTGLSAYLGGDKAHLGHSLKYHCKNVNQYLIENPNLDISKFLELPVIGSQTDSQYVIGALLCDIIIKHGGISMLKKVFDDSVTDDKLYKIIYEITGTNKATLNILLRDKINLFSNDDYFLNFKNNLLF